MQDVFITAIAMSAIGIGLRVWFFYAGARAIGSVRSSRRHEDHGMSFEDKVARRLAELPRDNARRDD